MDKNKKSSRRDFFKLGFLKGKQEVVKKIQKKVPRIGIRPPGALEEDEFILACTRCDDCVTACPHDAIFKPAYSEANIYGGTPFMDFKENACEMCTDFPCISSCKPGALKLVDNFLKVGVAKLNEEHCLVKQGQMCDYCARSCPKEYGALTFGEDRMPIIDEDLCVGCGKCEYICVSQSGKAIEVKWIEPIEEKDKEKEESVSSDASTSKE